MKLLDNNTSGVTIDPSIYKGMRVWDETTGLSGYVINYLDGFEATDPELKTVYVNYQNSGNGGETTFAAADILTVDNGRNSIFSVTISDGSTGFSNSDEAVFSSCIEVDFISGSFSNGDYVGFTNS